jgi:hypothetical protein
MQGKLGSLVVYHCKLFHQKAVSDRNFLTWTDPEEFYDFRSLSENESDLFYQKILHLKVLTNEKRCELT